MWSETNGEKAENRRPQTWNRWGNVCTGYSLSAFGLSQTFTRIFVRNTTEYVIYRDQTEIREGKCQQLTVQTQMVQVLPSVYNRGFEKSQRVEFKPLHSSRSIGDVSRPVYICAG